DIYDDSCSISKNDLFTELDNSLNRAVKRQMISDVKLGCQLSGGVDSSLVTFYALQNLNEKNLETISVIFENKNFSEEKYINELSASFNLKSHKFLLTKDFYLDVLNKAIWHYEQPLNHPNTIGIYLLSKNAKDYVTVLLSGEGAD